MQAAAPIAAALLAWVALGESVTRRTWIAMAVALIGIALMVGGPGSGGVVGASVSLLMTLAFAVGIVITRHRRDVSMAPAVCLSQLFVVLAVAPFASPGTVTERDLALLVLLGVGQMRLGLVFLTIGARLIPAAEVALITLLEVVLGPLWVWLALSEEPASTTIVGGPRGGCRRPATDDQGHANAQHATLLMLAFIAGHRAEVRHTGPVAGVQRVRPLSAWWCRRADTSLVQLPPGPSIATPWPSG